MDIVATFAKNRIFNYRVAVIGGVGGTVLVSGEVWIHHLYASGMPNWIRVGMMISTLLISVPVGLMVISLIGTLYRGAITFKTPMVYAVGFIFLFLVGGLTGIPHALVALDLHLHDTHFVVAHFHYVMAVAGTFAIIASVYYLFPKMTGKMCNEPLGKIGFLVSFIGANITFFTMFIVGFKGMPRRYFDYSMMPELESLQQIITIGSFILGIGLVITLLTWILALFSKTTAGKNPWDSASLEWTTVSPPGPGNWPEVPNCEDFDPYDYEQQR
jgi:cytochrome c oxidase subunit 1